MNNDDNVNDITNNVGESSPAIDEEIGDRIHNEIPQQRVVRELIRRNYVRHLQSDYQTTYFDERFRRRTFNTIESRNQQTTLSELLSLLCNNIIQRLTSGGEPTLTKLADFIRTLTGVGGTTGQNNQLLKDRFEKSILIRE
ncbi:csrA [Acrasis kona]|uniref:CsrA n=1 Tax=Acrasis kona TaxID=1008807 RepID=A0AAW2YHX4_9EUKA